MYPLKKINFRCTTKKIIQEVGARNVATIKRFKICYSKFLQFNLIKDMHLTFKCPNEMAKQIFLKSYAI